MARETEAAHSTRASHSLNLQLGFTRNIIDNNHITCYIITENISAVTNFPIPTNFKALHSFLGLASYFRPFIGGFSILAKPLYNLLKQERKCTMDFRFGSLQMESFEKIKTKLVNKPLLRIYSTRLETQLHCDASSHGFASILVQKQADGHFHPVFFFSKRTSPAEEKFHSFELEALSIVYSLQRFRVYLQGIKFTIVTDYNSLKLTLEKRDINPRILRWSLVLHYFDYQLEHRKGERM